MEIKRDNGGSLVISEDVIAKIASAAATDVPGVAGVVTKPVDIKKLFKNSGSARSVYVSSGESQTVIDIYISLKSGAKVTDVAERVQSDIKEAVQNMTGKVVSKVNVHICEIELATEDKAE